MQRLAGKVAIVTGATSGIGAEVVRRLVGEGARVLATGRSSARGEALVEDVGAGVGFVAADLTEGDAARRIVAAAIQAHGALDALVNGAALDHTADLLEASIADARAVFEVNVFAALGLIQEAARAMSRGGAIVNITSRLASVGVPTMAVYGASKGALLALTRGAAVELAPRGIRVNAVAPGMTRTPLYDAWRERSGTAAETLERDVLAVIPQGRLGEPRDIAAAVAYLVSDDAVHVTGASLAVDGGYTAA